MMTITLSLQGILATLKKACVSTKWCYGLCFATSATLSFCGIVYKKAVLSGTYCSQYVMHYCVNKYVISNFCIIAYESAYKRIYLVQANGMSIAPISYNVHTT